jgi:hypothetical protein
MGGEQGEVDALAIEIGTELKPVSRFDVELTGLHIHA